MKKLNFEKITSIFGTMIIVILVLIGIVSTIRIVSEKMNGNDNAGFKKPSEDNHTIALTINDVETELQEVAELMTYEYYYAGTASFSDSRQFLITGWDVPFTEHEIKMTYAGTIKVGYDLNQMDIEVDNDKRIITITLGDQIIDNNLPEESVETIEKNNLLNLIRSDEVTNRLVEIKNEEYINAVDLGITELAEENIKKIIEEKLSGIEGYKVYFK